MMGGVEINPAQILNQVVQGAVELLNPLLSVFTSTLVIVVGGILSWRAQRWWTKPILEAGGSGIIPWRPHNLGNSDVYRVPIENTGRRAAKNCKAQIFAIFESGNRRYEIETAVPWSGQEGTHTTINPGEISYFYLFTHDGTNNMMSVPASDNFKDEGLILQYPSGEDEVSPIISTKVSAQIFDDAEVEQMIFKVTSENCSAISREFRVDADGTPYLTDPNNE